MRIQRGWIVTHFEEVMSTLLLSLMAILAFAGVITRYVFHVPIAFTEELEVNGLVWLTLFGTASAFRRQKHLRMMFLQEKMSRSWQRILSVTINLLSIALFGVLGYLGYMQLLDERLLEITSESLNIPQWIYTVCIPAGCTLIIARIIESAYHEIKGWD